MTNDLTTARTALRDALDAAGLHAFVTLPERATPPMTFVGPGDPYVTPEGASFGGEIVRHDVVIVAAAGVNEKKAESLDDMILTAVDAILAVDGQVVEDVDRPGQISLGGQTFLATTIHVKTEIHREA